MKKNLFINVNCVAQKNSSELLFAKNVINSLFQLNKNLRFHLNFIVDDKQDLVNQKVLNILEREDINFNIIEKFDAASDDYIIKNKEEGFEILLDEIVISQLQNWNQILNYFRTSLRKISHSRRTNETEIDIEINLDGTGIYNVSTGLGFFNHMLEQLSKHSFMDLSLNVQGDLQIDEHHTIEDTAITLGESILQALGDRKGIQRYGFLLPMDDCLAQVAIDFGGRNWLVWEAEFKREKIGDVPTEMFYHFFKSFSDAAKCNLNIKGEGVNEHHKIESIFKAFAKAIKMAIAVDYESDVLPTTKGIL